MKNTVFFPPNLVAKISLKKRKFFGLFTEEITVFVTFSLKIVGITKPKGRVFLYNTGDTLNTEDFSKWIYINHYDFSFYTKSKSLKRILILEVDLPIDMLKSKLDSNQKSLFKRILKWFNF